MSSPVSPATPPKPPARRGRAVQLVVAAALIAGVYYWGNRPTADVRQTGPYEPAPAALPPAEDAYTSREIPPFSISIDEAPLTEGTRWAYESSFEHLITIDYVAADSGPGNVMAVRSIDHNPLFNTYISRTGSRIVERTDAPEGTLSMVYEFPLENGKSWTFSSRGLDTDAAPGTLAYRVEVEAAEEITVPNGTYPCLRIRTAIEGSDAPGAVLWYSPNVGMVRLRTGDGGTMDLIYFGPIPPVN